ncbi:P-loop NTPase [Desulfonema magnum]|uniref:CobQ/CobB/MinD/ParA nucleotide binding domain-containing protein n=1 Tax=Desulfonema magnum TaxID=45655 RepID=A0A975BMZ3_9BACT|nr:P-loop NTPase [Desulfonema magnum]QTA88247.1 CobQ/CobB/MinD/ParA nucleotide binding domain-containing protein [Desulfonema magnum]
MKILICGKGGSGKSTLSVLIAKNLKKKGYNVLVVDADESNLGLHRLMGVPMPVNLMDNLGGKKEFKKKISQAFPKGTSQGVFDKKWGIQDIPEAYAVQTGGIKLLPIGKIHNFGEGCACPMGVLSKMFLSNLEVTDNDAVIIDTEAGIEHFGRGLEAGCDMILGVVDPSFESFMLAKKMEEMGQNAEISVFFILNKVDEQVEAAMSQHISSEKVVARISKNNTIFMKSLQGEELTMELPEIDQVCQFLIKGN